MKNIYDGFTLVTRLSLNNTKGSYTVGKDRKDYKADFYGLKNGEGIDFPKLLNYLKSGQKDTLCYWRFKGTPTKERQVVISYGVVETGRILNNTIPWGKNLQDNFINSFYKVYKICEECLGENKPIYLSITEDN